MEEVADLKLTTIEQYYEKSAKYAELRTDLIVRNYWKFIKYMAFLLKSRNHILYFPRSQRSEFLNTLSPNEIMTQMETLG